jgi:hypothetical protein
MKTRLLPNTPKLPKCTNFFLMEAVRSGCILQATSLLYQNEQIVLGQVACSKTNELFQLYFNSLFKKKVTVHRIMSVNRTCQKGHSEPHILAVLRMHTNELDQRALSL